MKLTRRQLAAATLGSAAAMGTNACSQAKKAEKPARKGQPLDLQDFQPRSMLSVPEHPVERARFPVIDVHTHLSFAGKDGEHLNYSATPEQLLPVMDRRNIKTLVNLTGGVASTVKESVQKYDLAHPGRFITFTQPFYNRAKEPGYPKLQADLIERAKNDGARGLKILKTLGLFLRDPDGKLVKVDDPRFDPMWEACGELNLPVAIHVSDPVAFFTPIDRYNERFEELNNHPDWSFYGKDFPSNDELLDARDRVIARHPRTQFIVLHFGNYSENLAHVAERMDRFPNFHVEFAARIGELGRQPRASRKFFDKYQDRIMFGTDAIYNGYDTPQQIFGDELYRIYYRFLETEDEYFDYAPAPVPPQGRWRIYGLGLPDQILRKVYYQNAERLLHLA
ncbi:MAG: amidohydrolase family protein [Acidobacteriota bacterium]